MSPSVSAALGLDAAPGGLALVQDLLNTWPVGGYRADLLAERSTAEEWLVSLGLPRSAARELEALRALRAQLRTLARHELGDRAESQSPDGTTSLRTLALARVRLDADGMVRVEAAGEGVERVASAAWLAVAAAQGDGRTPESGQWERLKLCRNEDCGSAFYDRSRNNSRVWHDVRSCGNQANLRAYRQRKAGAK